MNGYTKWKGCTSGTCQRRAAVRGLCRAHYARKHRGVSVAGPIGNKVGRQPGLRPRLKTLSMEQRT